MAAIRMVYLDCDNGDCMASTSDEGTQWTAAEAREHAKTLGWVRRNNKDLCPDCAAGHDPRPSASPYWTREEG